MKKQKIIVRYLLPIVHLHPNENLKIRIRNNRSRPKMAHLGEGMQSCDLCGAVGRVGEFISIYHEGRGQKVDYCPRCFDREVVKRG